MNLFQLASRGIDLDALPDESAPEREPLAFEPSPAGSRFAVPQEFDAAFQAAGDEYGVDPDVLRAMAFAESRFRPDVISGQVKSRTGAAGLMQFMPGTAERFGINPLDPVESIFGAAAYMRANLEKFNGDYGKAVAAYNWGENRKAYDAEDWQALAPKETQGYLKTVFGAADELKLRAPAPASDAGTAVALPAGVAASTAGAGRGSVSPGMVNTKIPRAAVPDMTFGGVAQDVASGLLQVGPTAVKGVGEVIRLATGDRLGKGVTDFAERGIQATQDMVGSERAAAQRQNFAADMADDSVGLGTALANNKGALADQILPTIGSMFIPVGAAGAAGKLATVGKAARGLNTAALAARVASVQQAAGIGATAAQNAASTFAEMLDKGVPMQDAYTAAGITVPFSLIAGKLTGGGAEGALIKGLSGQNIARGVGEVVKGVLREGAQEGGESLGQVTGEVLGANQDVSLQSGVKRVGTEALLGAVMGGGMNAAQQIVPTVESQPTTPTAPVVPQASAVNAPPPDAAQAVSNIERLMAQARGQDLAGQILQAEQTAAPSGLAAELDALRARSAPDFTQQSTTPQAQPGSVPVTGGLAAELQALRARSSPQEAANAPQRTPSDTQQQTKATGAQAADVAGVNAPVPASNIPGAGVAATQAAGVDVSTTEGVPANVPQPAQPGTQASQTQSTQGTTTGARVVLQNRDRSTPSSIAQMRSIAARPDYGRLGFSRDFANGAPVVAGGTIQPAQLGRQDVATASDGRRIPVQYAVVDAGSVLTSNTVDGTSNPSYGDSNIPAVRAIAGNGRIAGLQSAYQSGNANAYRQELVQDASLHGIAPEVIAPMAQPVLVRVMPAEAVTADIGDISNTVGNLDLSAVEQASNDANRVTLDALQFAEDGSITPEVVRQFVRAMPQAEQGQLLDTNGQPTRQAVDRLSAAVFAKAYGNEALTRLYSQAQDPEARLVMSALAQVAPKMARLEGAGALDVRDVVAQAAEIAVNARRQGIAIAKAAQQMDMAADPDVGVVLDLFASNARTVRPVVEALGRMADMAYTEASKPAEDMFGAVPRASRADIINQLRPENERGSQEALEDAAGRESAAVDAVGQANEPAGSATSATTEAGRPAEDAAPEGLNSYTPEEVAQRQAEAAQAEATAKRAEDAAARAEAAARQAKEIAQRSAAAADTFELGQSGEDNLSGQGGLMFSFAGARAATADTHALATAQDRLAAGENPETVRRETGWHRGADGRMRFEISDKDASMKIGRKATPLKSFARDLVRELDRPLRLSDVLDHPALFAAYPAVADYGVTFVPTEAMPDQARGTYSDGRIMLADDMPAHEALSTLLHEIQHGIQNIEGFATGDSVDRLAKTMPDEKAMNDAKLLARFMAKGESAFDARQRFMRYMGRDPNPQGAYLAERYEPGEIARMAATPLDAYQRSAGEVEARNTQARRGMTDAERRATPPGKTADVADSDVIVVFNGKEMASAPTPANAAGAKTTTPIAAIRQSLTSAYGNLLQRLESKGLVSLTQTDEDAIAAAAQARADKNGGDAEQIKQSLMASVRNSLSPMKSIDANVRRGLQSLAKALDGKTSVNRAMFRNGLGWVDFVWGDAGVVKPNGKTKGAMGISHILEARQRKDGMTEPQVIRLLEGIVDTIASGQELRRNETGGVERVVVERNGIEATLVKSKGSNAWLLSGWEVKNPDELSAANVATEPTLVEPTTSRFNKGAGFADIMGFNGLDVKRSADGNLEGFFDPETGKSYLIADNLTAESAPGTLMHEVGIHMAADGKLQPLFERAAQLLSADRGNAFIQRVQARMDRSGETSGEEAAAYIVTEYENDRTSAPASVSKWVQDFIASVRAWLFNKGALLKADQLTVADIAAVARANARSMARGDGWMGDGARRFSKAPSASEQAGRDTAPSRIFYSRAPGSGVAAGSAPPIPTSAQDAALKWRDASGRLQFAPGAWLFDKMGAVASPVLSWAGMKSASPELKRQLREMKLGVQRAQQTSAMIATETAKLSQEEREMVSDLIEKTLKAGVIPPAHAVKLAALINETMSAQTDELIELGMLSAETAERWRGEYLPRFYADKLRTKTDPWADALKSITRRARVMMGMKGKHLKARGLFEVVPTDQVADYEALGWELRDPGFDPANDKTAQMWRDFTKEERESMGEIRDAGFRFVMGYMQTQKDIALGRMYKRLADSDAMSSRYATGEFSVRVPETKVEGTGANVYGALAGKYVSKDTLDHLSGFGEVHNDMLQTYRKAMSLWKEGKTVLNPVSHINNTVSNVTMAHLAGVGYHRVDKYAAAVRDLATSAPMVQQAKDAGLFLGGFNEAELFDAMPDELKALAKIQEGTGTKVVNGLMQVLTFGLRKPMAKAYEFEDSFFKYLIFRDARSRGMEAEDAVEYAQKYIFTYDDLPKTARRIRDFGLPFFAYTYKAVPALLEAALTHPVRMALPATAIWAATTLAYALAEAGGDEPLDELAKRYATDEKFRDAIRARKDYDQEHLPKWMRGYTALAVPKSIRVGMDETLEMPLFMDISRVVPGGDIFDVTPNAGGLPLPQVLTPNHPVLTLFTGLIANKDAFKGSDLVDKNDTSAEAAEKRTAWVYRQVAPAMAVGNYHWDRGMEMLAQIAGGEIKWLPDSVSERYTGMGKDGLPIAPKYGIPQTFGIKIRPIDQEKAEAIERAMDNKLLREIDAEIRQINRLNSLGAMSDKMADKKRDYQIEKKDRIRDGLTVDGEAKD